MASSSIKLRKKSIAPIPFDYNEIVELTSLGAPLSLQHRLVVWKNSGDFKYIKELENLVLYGNHIDKMSKQEKELKDQYLNWCVSIEKEKFDALDLTNPSVRLADKKSPDNNEDGTLDLFVHYKGKEEEEEEDAGPDTLDESTTAESDRIPEIYG